MSSVIAATLSATKWRRVVDCLKKSWPGGASSKNLAYTCWRKSFKSMPSISLNFRVRARSCRIGFPVCSLRSRSTFRQSHDHATSWSESQPFGTKDRKDASITALNSAKSMGPLHLDNRNDSTSHSSCSLWELETLQTIASKESKTSNIQSRSAKPMTAALNLNICGKVVGISMLLPLLRSAALTFELPLPLLGGCFSLPGAPTLSPYCFRFCASVSPPASCSP
mmetsp:Transcript_54878/g.158791  ORF Transcript_54878/g.158791 Transcript_54878/m.158791 type:complete len:224 (-) Transcript_54878:541-1212(-)